MAELVICPKCSRQLRVPDDLLGKTVKCPNCKEAFLAQTASGGDGNDAPSEPAPGSASQRVSTRRSDDESESAPAPRIGAIDDEDHPSRGDDYDEDDYSRPGGSAGTRLGWQRVRTGVNLMIWGLYVMIGCGILAILCALAALLIGGFGIFTAISAGNSNAAGAGAGGAVVGAIVMGVVAYGTLIFGSIVKLILDGIGQVFNLWIPDRPGTGRRGLAIAALSLWGAQLVLPLFSCGLQLVGVSMRNPNAMSVLGLAANCSNLISGLCTIAWFFVFMFFLRAVALGVDDRRLARTVFIFMITVPVWGVLAFMSFIVVACLGGMAAIGIASKSGTAGGAASIGTGYIIALVAMYGLILLISLALWIWYLVILHQTHRAISRRLAR